MSDTFQALESRVDRHEKALLGDMLADPPRPGVMQVLQEMYAGIRDPEKGLIALHHRTTALEINDTKRVAWFGGAKWVIISLASAVMFVLGLYFGHK